MLTSHLTLRYVCNLIKQKLSTDAKTRIGLFLGDEKMKKYFQNGNAYLLIALLVMILLFISSSQTYNQQAEVQGPFLEKLLKSEPLKNQLQGIALNYAGKEISIAESGYFKFVEFFIRKAAHFLTYFVMGGSLFLGIRPKMRAAALPAMLAWLSATGYAALDEFHQMLTGGRTPLFQDVVLDSVGAVTAIVLVYLFHALRRK